MRGFLQLKYAGLVCLVLFTGLTFSGCNLFRKSTSNKVEMTEDENVVRKVIGSQQDWKFLEIRLTGKADEDGKKVGFMGTVRMEKDNQIYVLIRTSIGIEIARVYANRDSVWLLSKMMNIKEKVDWKMAGRKLGYPVDFYAMQGIFVQSLFTSSGNQLINLISNLIVKDDKENLRLISNTDFRAETKEIKYFNDFSISRESFIIQGVKIRDINGQWIADVKYLYNKENLIKKIELKGIDSEHNFAAEINIVKKELADFIEINFDKF